MTRILPNENIAPALNETEQLYAEYLQTLRNEANVANARLALMLQKCEHIIFQTKNGCAQCAVCSTVYNINWCAYSPDHLCHYFTNEHGQVELINGTAVDAPTHDVTEESERHCLYCNLER
jgi:hypothetical protein